jgi:hypothetical protein
MRKLLIAGVALCLLSTRVMAASPVPVPDPEKFATDFVNKLSNNGSREAASVLAYEVGRPEYSADAQRLLQFFDGKTFDFTRKVIDRDFNGALRQIVLYSYIKGVGAGAFVYFRFNYKMTSAGWVLANFTFKDETSELFPKEFTDRAS